MYVKGGVASKELGVSIQTLRKWADQGRIKYMRTPTNIRLYDLSSVVRPAGRSDSEDEEEGKERKSKFIYARVSCSKQKDDLERQIGYLKSKYPDHQVVRDIGSGINFHRKGLQRILEAAINGNVKEVVVAHRDRLCRIAYDHFFWLFERLGVRLIVENREEHSIEEELSDDLFSIIHVFSSRHYGSRRRYTKIDTAGDEHDEEPEDALIEDEEETESST